MAGARGSACPDRIDAKLLGKLVQLLAIGGLRRNGLVQGGDL